MTFDQFKANAIYVLTYLFSVVVIVSANDPTAIPPKWLPWIAGANLALAGIGHAIPIAKPTVQTIAKSFVGAMLACLLGLAALTMPGCATAPTATQQAAVSVAINIAAGRAIQRSDTDPAVWKARATEYKAAALRLAAVNDAGTATVATLMAEVQPLVVKLGPADQLAAQTLIAALTPFLQEQIDSRPEVANARDTVSNILSTFIKACEAYGA